MRKSLFTALNKCDEFETQTGVVLPKVLLCPEIRNFTLREGKKTDACVRIT